MQLFVNGLKLFAIVWPAHRNHRYSRVEGLSFYSTIYAETKTIYM